MNVQKIIRHPAVSIGAVVLGIFAGLYLRNFSLACKPVGDVFLILLNMCVLPIMITSIISSVGLIVADKSRSISIIRILLCYLAAFFIVEIFSYIFTMLLKPGVLSSESQDVLGSILLQAEKGSKASSAVSAAIEEPAAVTGVGLFKKLVPSNIFEALSSGNSLQVLFSSLVIGIATGFVERNKEKFGIHTSIIDLSTALFKVTNLLLNAFMLLLPVGLFCMTASQISVIGIDVIKAMLRFVICIYILCVLIFIACSIIIAIRLKIKIWAAITGLKDCLLVAFASRSSLASMPVAIENLINLGVNKNTVNFIVPLGAVIARFSMLILYVCSLVFTSQLYEIQLNFIQVVQGLILCLFAGIAGVGSPAVVSISLMSIIFVPIGLPYSAITTLILMIIAVVDPILTLVNVQINCTCTIFIDKKK